MFWWWSRPTATFTCVCVCVCVCVCHQRQNKDVLFQSTRLMFPRHRLRLLSAHSPVSLPARLPFIIPSIMFRLWHLQHSELGPSGAEYYTLPHTFALVTLNISHLFHVSVTLSTTEPWGHWPWKWLLTLRYPTLSRRTDSLSRRPRTSSENGSRPVRRSSSTFRRSRWRLDGLVFTGGGFKL